MNSRQVEERAVLALKNQLMTCTRLQSRIESGDKEPFVDGEINIYDDASGKNSSFFGQVKIQVKGKSFNPKRPGASSYKIKRADLEGYLKLSGVLFFVVFIDQKSHVTFVHYVTLSPNRIHYLLRSMSDEQSKKSVHTQPLPEDPAKIEAIVRQAYRAQEQKPQQTIDPSVFENLAEVTIHTDGSVALDGPVHLRPSDHDYTVVLKTSAGMEVATNVEMKLVPEDYLGQPSDLTISSGDATFANPIRRTLDKIHVALELTPGLRLILKRTYDGDQGGSIKWKMSSNLKDRIDEITFMLSSYDTQGFYLNGKIVKWRIEEPEAYAELRDHLNFLHRISAVLEHVGADISLIDLDQVEKKRLWQLLDLYAPLVERQKISQEQLEFEGGGHIWQPIGPWALHLICLPDEEEGHYVLYHLFDPDMSRVVLSEIRNDDGTTGHMPVTPYEFLEEDRFCFVLNLGLDRIVETYERYSEDGRTLDNATNTVLKLINAADYATERRQEFLAAAERLNDWLLAQTDESLIVRVNKFQLIRRQRALTDDERSEIRALRSEEHRSDHPMAPSTIVGCSILLEEFEQAEHDFSNLPDHQQDAMRTWPIWMLRTQEAALERMLDARRAS